MEKNEVITLEDRGFIQVNGSEAKDFLQNIVTNDIEKVTSDSTVFSSILTPQGKYLFEFFVLKLNMSDRPYNPKKIESFTPLDSSYDHESLTTCYFSGTTRP